MNALIDYTDKELSVSTTGDLAQSQKYGSVEAGTSLTQTYEVGDYPLTLAAGLAVRQGLGDDKVANPLVQADLGYLLFRPQLGAQIVTGNWTSQVRAVAQITSDTLPENSQWVMGGVGNVATSLPGVASGDSGALLRMSVQYDTWDVFGPDWEFVPSVFAEYGYSKFENQLGGLLPGGTPAVSDVGVEATLKWNTLVAFRLTYAEKISDENLSDATLQQSDANVYFNLVIDL